jgi:2'-5' RNA ligase
MFGTEDHAWLNAQRKTHFPTERNVLAAHLTLFHHLPPAVEDELRQRLRVACIDDPPRATLAGLMSLGRGVAYRVESPALEAMRAELAEAFAPLLTPQDKAGWRPHVTIQNKAEPAAARALLAELKAGFKPRPLSIAGLAAWWYRGGPWEAIGALRFGGGRPMQPPR